jgi:hypothetical protein
MGDETKSFLLRVANRIFTSRELSQPEVLSYLLGFRTDFTNVLCWTWVHLNSLYWASARQWPALSEALSAHLGRDPQPDNVYFQADGFKLPYLEAYKHRGPVLQDLCFYESDHRHKSWFQDWDAMPESTLETEAADEDGSLWCESEDSESESRSMS